MVNLDVDVDTSRALSELKRAKTRLKAGTGDALDALADYTKNKARLYAPSYSGPLPRRGRSTIRSIRKENISFNKKRVRVTNPTANRTDGFNLARWMHQDTVRSAGWFRATSPEQHINSGVAKFMDRAEDDARRFADEIVRKEIDKIEFNR